MIRFFCTAVLLFGTLASTTSGQLASDRLTALTVNDGFETGTSGWNGDNSVVNWLTRRYVPDPALPSSAQLGSRFLELPGAGSFSQWTWVDSSQPHQIVSIQASRTGAGWAGYGVTYLDGYGNVVDSMEQEIPQRSSFQPGQAIEPLSFGAFVPEDAMFAVIWVANNDPGSSVYFDEFGLYDYQVANPSSLLPLGWDLQTVTSDPANFTGTEFFLPGFAGSENGIAPATFTTGGYKGLPVVTRPAIAFGQPGIDTVAYQTVRLTPGHNYRMPYYTNVVPGTLAVVGFDFLDDQGNPVGKVFEVLPEGVPNPFTSMPSLDFQVPAGTAVTNFWIYVAPTETPMRFGTLNLNIAD